jgi:drug/metabolite transporter (DMT)-like permease
MKWLDGVKHTGVPAALGAAILFGVGTPLAKLLLNSCSPWLLAGLLYLGSGVGLTLVRVARRSPPVKLPRQELGDFLGAILAGGIIGPVLLMWGLARMPASGASLLLNAESVFTALLAWFAFKENFDRRIALGMLAIVAGAMVLSWQGDARFSGLSPSLAVLGACLAWGIDNNLTRKVSLNDAVWIASVKGLVAGSVNLGLALALGADWPELPNIGGAMLVGFLSYGLSLTLFVQGLRHLGTARTGAYFSVAPFIGALLALLLGDPLTPAMMFAGVLMAVGLWLHLTEHHEHAHHHPALTHEHRHQHDAHHQHEHPFPIPPGSWHQHVHEHAPQRHSHPHYPDEHHRHSH